MYKNTYVMNEKSVQIPQKNMINNVKTTPTNDYSLNKNFFDPAKSSPPNEFMIKLHMRNIAYNLSHKNDDNFEIQ